MTYLDYGKVVQKQVPESTNSFWESCKLKVGKVGESEVREYWSVDFKA